MLRPFSVGMGRAQRGGWQPIPVSVSAATNQLTAMSEIAWALSSADFDSQWGSYRVEVRVVIDLLSTEYGAGSSGDKLLRYCTLNLDLFTLNGLENRLNGGTGLAGQMRAQISVLQLPRKLVAAHALACCHSAYVALPAAGPQAKIRDTDQFRVMLATMACGVSIPAWVGSMVSMLKNRHELQSILCNALHVYGRQVDSGHPESDPDSVSIQRSAAESGTDVRERAIDYDAVLSQCGDMVSDICARAAWEVTDGRWCLRYRHGAGFNSTGFAAKGCWTKIECVARVVRRHGRAMIADGWDTVLKVGTAVHGMESGLDSVLWSGEHYEAVQDLADHVCWVQRVECPSDRKKCFGSGVPAVLWTVDWKRGPGKSTHAGGALTRLEAAALAYNHCLGLGAHYSTVIQVLPIPGTTMLDSQASAGESVVATQTRLQRSQSSRVMPSFDASPATSSVRSTRSGRQWQSTGTVFWVAPRSNSVDFLSLETVRFQVSATADQAVVRPAGMSAVEFDKTFVEGNTVLAVQRRQGHKTKDKDRMVLARLRDVARAPVSSAGNPAMVASGPSESTVLSLVSAPLLTPVCTCGHRSEVTSLKLSNTVCVMLCRRKHQILKSSMVGSDYLLCRTCLVPELSLHE